MALPPVDSLKYEHIKTEQSLGALCRRLESAQRICFDTEFVSEFSYRPGSVPVAGKNTTTSWRSSIRTLFKM